MKTLHFAISLSVVGLYAMAQQSPATGPPAASDMGGMHHHNTHEHDYPAAVSFGQLKDTVAQLERVRQATAKYRDVKIAEADGYKGVGVEIKGMGIHYLRELEPKAFHLEKPSMLCYEKDASRSGGYSLVGVAYLMKSEEGPDGQPVSNPFPKPLAIWHKHENVCVLPNANNIEHTIKLTEDQCRHQGGHFLNEWMLHAWVWKDSPRGVFSPSNPVVAVHGVNQPE